MIRGRQPDHYAQPQRTQHFPRQIELLPRQLEVHHGGSGT